MAGKFGGKKFGGFGPKGKAKRAAKQGVAKKAKNIAGCSSMTGICGPKRKRKPPKTKPLKFKKIKKKFRPGGGGGGGDDIIKEAPTTRYKNVRYL